MTSHICIASWAKSAQGWIQGGAKIGPGGSLLQRTSDRKATATNRMHSSDLEAFGKKYNCLFLVSLGIQIFDRVLDVFLVYFNAIFINFCAIKSLSALILCNFYVYKWENA